MKRVAGFIGIAGIITAATLASRFLEKTSSTVYSLNIVSYIIPNIPTGTTFVPASEVTGSSSTWTIGTFPNQYGYWQYTERPIQRTDNASLRQKTSTRSSTTIYVGPRYLTVFWPLQMAVAALIAVVVLIISTIAVSVRWICEGDDEHLSFAEQNSTIQNHN